MDWVFGKIFVFSEHPSAGACVVVRFDHSPARAHRFLIVDADLAAVSRAVETFWSEVGDEYSFTTFLTNVDWLAHHKLEIPGLETKPFIRVADDSSSPELELSRQCLATDERFLSTRGWFEPFSIDRPEVDRRLAEKRRRKKMLLHICCGPDAAGVINQLKNEFDLVCFWYDPNIQPKEEHDLRLEAFERVAQIEGVPYIVGEYDVYRFYDAIRGLEQTPEQGAKCSNCYDLRLERSAREALAQKCDVWSTTLAISPHKVQRKLAAFGKLSQDRYGVKYLARNFMKHDGFKDSVEFTREHDIYRQDYCGCYFSLGEGGPAAQWLATQLPAATDVEAERPLSLLPGVHHRYLERAAMPKSSSVKPHKG